MHLFFPRNPLEFNVNQMVAIAVPVAQFHTQFYSHGAQGSNQARFRCSGFQKGELLAEGGIDTFLQQQQQQKQQELSTVILEE